MTDDEIKVNDKRMFTPEGELKNEFQHLEQSAAEQPPASEVEPEPQPSTEPEISAPADRSEDAAVAEPEGAESEAPAVGELPDELGFLDLVSLVAQPIAIYLGDAKLPGGESAENLDLARLHIDLLEVLRDKTSGNRTEQEESFLKELLYQVRLRYVQKRG